MTKTQWIKENLKPGEEYAGMILGKDGAPDYHLALLPGEADKLTWPKAETWAKEVGGELPTRREQSLLYANLPEQFRPAWYWSAEQYAGYASCAWAQSFYYGDQYYYRTRKTDELRARAVRRLPIE